jgi:hypothetical protein
VTPPIPYKIEIKSSSGVAFELAHALLQSTPMALTALQTNPHCSAAGWQD